MTSQSLAIRKISTDAPWRWLALGAKDMARAPLLSLSYGLVFVAVGALITYGLWRVGLAALIPVALAGFALVGPILAVGLYEISRRLETGERLSLTEIILVRTAAPVQLAYLGFFLLASFMVWARIAQLLFALIVRGDYPSLTELPGFLLTTPEGLTLLAAGSAIGAVIAFVIFAMSAFSIPILMRRDVDVVSAVIFSIDTVKKNFAAMLLWAWIIAITMALGVALFGVGLAIAFPLIGLATWHAYRDAVGGPP